MPTLALIAHDAKKETMVAWAAFNKDQLANIKLVGTGTTGGRIEDATGLHVHRYLSGPLGGDAQISALIAEQEVDGVIFFVDAMTSQPHDVDIKSLIRLAIYYDCPLALNPSTADALLTALIIP